MRRVDGAGLLWWCRERDGWWHRWWTTVELDFVNSDLADLDFVVCWEEETNGGGTTTLGVADDGALRSTCLDVLANGAIRHVVGEGNIDFDLSSYLKSLNGESRLALKADLGDAIIDITSKLSDDAFLLEIGFPAGFDEVGSASPTTEVETLIEINGSLKKTRPAETSFLAGGTFVITVVWDGEASSRTPPLFALLAGCDDG